MKTLSDIGESAAIQRLATFLPSRADVIVGIGDDAAVVRPSRRADRDWVLTSDAVIEGTHFVLRTTPRAVGHKAIGRVLSDLAAMGADPDWALVDLVAPANTPQRKLDEIYRGIAKLARKANLAVIGGDLAKGNSLQLHVFGIGSLPKGTALLRSGARVGDAIFVTGTLGGSLKRKHLAFQPRLDEGIFLRKWATAMIDVSDGLATDLHHLVIMSKVGAELNVDRIPISSAVRKTARPHTRLEHALCDGEDFELLFTVPTKRVSSFVRAWKKRFRLRCTPIGTVTKRKGEIVCVAKDAPPTPLTTTGYQHF